VATKGGNGSAGRRGACRRSFFNRARRRPRYRVAVQLTLTTDPSPGKPQLRNAKLRLCRGTVSSSLATPPPGRKTCRRIRVWACRCATTIVIPFLATVTFPDSGDTPIRSPCSCRARPNGSPGSDTKPTAPPGRTGAGSGHR